MIMRFLCGLLLVLVTSAASVTETQGVSEAEKLLARAEAKATAEGDLRGAIELYQQVPKAPGATRQLSARALIGMGQAYEKLKAFPEARAAYDRVVRGFPDVVELVRTANEHLARIPVQSPSGLTVRTPDDVPGRLSPDGRYLVRQHVAGSERQRVISIVLRDMSTKVERTLVGSLRGAVREFWFSPNSRHVAAQVLVQPMIPKRYQEQLVVADVLGTRQPIVIDAAMDDTKGDWERLPVNWRHVAWSPDGTRLPYLAPVGTSGLSEAKLLTVATGVSEPLGVATDEAGDFTWSPAGDRLALRVSNAATGTDEIRLLNLATREAKSIPIAPAGKKTKISRWTRSDRIALRRWPGQTPLVMDVMLLDASTGHVTITCSGGPSTDASISLRAGDTDVCGSMTADGSSQIVWNRRTKQLLVRDTSTLTDRRLTRGSGEEHGGELSPDGRLVVFVSNRNSQWGVYAVPLERSEEHEPVLLVKLDDAPLGFSATWRDGTVLASAFVEEISIQRVTMETRTGKSTGPLERLTENSRVSTGPVYSPDGRHIAYWARTGTVSSLSVMDATGANERTIMTMPPGDGSFAPPLWRSNREVIVQMRPRILNRKNQQDLVSIDIGSGRTSPLGRSDPTWGGFAIVRDRDELVYFVTGVEQKTIIGLCCGADAAPDVAPGSHVWRARSLSTGTERDLVSFTDVDGYVDSFTISADGSAIALLFARRSTFSNCGCELRLLDVATGRHRVIASNLANFQVPVALSPDGRFLLFGAMRPRILDITSGTPSPLMPTPAAQPDWGEQSGSWSPDGAFIVVPSSTSRTQRWQIDGVTFDAVVKASKR